MWYSDRYRRHLCDMHIDDWDPEFLSQFSPEEYVENLKRAKINNAMLYFQSHVGLCYYPTKSGKMHEAFRGKEDLMRKLCLLCHENDIKVTGYYSINYNTWAHDQFPDWRMIKENGLSRREEGDAPGEEMAFASKKAARYGLCCPNHEEYRQFVYAQVDEMLEYLPMDALFFDMPFWSHTCYCKKCQARWAKEFGGEIPINPERGTREYDLLFYAKHLWMGEWALALSAYVKSKAPDLPVEYNYASAIAGNSQNGCGDLVNQASDYVGGDLYGGMMEHSFACKFYRSVTKNQPFEYMFSRCKPALRMHTLTKTLDEMKTSLAVTAAHHGATLVIDAIDPVGTMDQRVYERVGQMFDMQLPYEPYFKGEMLGDIGIYYNPQSRYTPREGTHHNLQSSVAMAKGLIQRHIPFGITGAYEDFSRYSYLAAPALTWQDRAEYGRLIDYVEKGGTLYISGGECRELVEELTGGILSGVTDATRIYAAPTERYAPIFGWFNEKYPLPFLGAAPVLQNVAREDVAAVLVNPYTLHREIRFASIHSDPPSTALTDIPMIVVKKRGKGKVIWSAATLEGMDYPEYQQIVQALIFWEKNRFSLESNAPAQVEFTLFRLENALQINAAVLSNDAEAHIVPGFEIRVKTERVPARVLLMPGKEEMPFRYEEGYTVFRARDLHFFDMYQIDL